MVFLVILILSFFLQMVLPWWIVVVVSFATCGLIGKTGKIALWSPFFAVSMLWTGVTLLKSVPNDHILASRVASMLSLPSWWLVLAVTVVIGGFVAGVSGYCGYHFRKAVLIRKTQD